MTRDWSSDVCSSDLPQLYKKADTPEENPEKEEDETDISSLSVEELRKIGRASCRERVSDVV